MKKVLTLSLLFAILLGSVAAIAQSSDPDSKVITKRFQSGAVITLPQSGSLPHFTSIIVSFEGGDQAAQWTVNLIRDGVTHKLVKYPESGTETGTTFVWYIPSEIHLKGGDQIVLGTGVSEWATALLSEQF